MPRETDFLAEAVSLQGAIELIHQKSDDLTNDSVKSAVDSTSHLMAAYATVSIAQSLADLAKLAMRLEPLLVRLEEELAKDGIHELKDHVA